MPLPIVENLPAHLRLSSELVARTLLANGHQAWIVGGAVRDLSLGLEPKDVDLATDALPERVESLFPKTSAIGKAFGTILVHVLLGEDAGGEFAGTAQDLEVTTFREDGHYEDGRRPERVTYGTSVQEDARRRDFTCNALYLDPLSGVFQDPEHGLADLDAGLLRCVGDPALRFAEDGLRLLRLARFEARFGLQPTEATLRGAVESRQSLGGVSVERKLAELGGFFAGPDPGRALRRIESLQLFEMIFPGFSLTPDWEARCAVFEADRERLSTGLGLALLLEPDPCLALAGPEYTRALGVAEATLLGLKPSRALRDEALAIWRGRRELFVLSRQTDVTRANRIRLLRRPGWGLLLQSVQRWAALFDSLGDSGADLAREMEAERSELSEADLRPAPLLSPSDLEQAGIPRGPRWGQLLEAAEAAQLDRQLLERAAALRWLADLAARGES